MYPMMPQDLMGPPVDKDKLKASLKNPWQAEMLEKDIELLTIAKKQKAQEVRYAEVANLFQTMLGFLICAAICDAIEMEKKGISNKIRGAKNADMSSREVTGLQIALERLG
ncbi:uncharacterized protein IAS62_006093 [Cryptococcus decagattii]|uniref:Uncharacterized protein n=1 Tax=Cryptococcus decagattii TaxID=1859122 RepID=A0ABZ2B5N0_9TREE